MCGIPIRDDFNADDQHCASIFHMSSHDGVRSGVGECYVEPARRRPNFVLETRALVHRVILENGRATGVEYTQSDGLRVARASREIIVSAGAVGSPQILDALRNRFGGSSSGARNRAENRSAGRRQEPSRSPVRTNHVSLSNQSSSEQCGALLFRPDPGVPGRQYGWFSRTLFEAGAFIKSEDSAPIPDVQIFTLPWGYPNPNQDGPGRPSVDSGHCFSVFATLIYPKSRGASCGSLRTIQAGCLSSTPHIWNREEDVALMTRAIRRCRAICEHRAMSSHLREELTPGAHRSSDGEILEDIRLRGTTAYHPAGTCKMGIDEMAVVDPMLRVRGVEGLRVADASIMPNVPRGEHQRPVHDDR